MSEKRPFAEDIPELEWRERRWGEGIYFVEEGEGAPSIETTYAGYVRAGIRIGQQRARAVASPATRHQRTMWGYDGQSCSWWLVLLKDGDPHLALNPSGEARPAFRDTFDRWATMEHPVVWIDPNGPRPDVMQPRRFKIVRIEDETGISGTGHIADGVQFHTGQCVIVWRTEYSSVAVYPDHETLMKIHGHEGKTVCEWIDY